MENKQNLSGYLKIVPFLNDVQVSKIECFGSSKEICVVRAGKKLKTKISLNENEIKEVFSEFSRLANIPIFEGKLRIKLDKLSFQGDLNNSSFFIKKESAYSLLEKRLVKKRVLSRRRIRR